MCLEQLLQKRVERISRCSEEVTNRYSKTREILFPLPLAVHKALQTRVRVQLKNWMCM